MTYNQTWVRYQALMREIQSQIQSPNGFRSDALKAMALRLFPEGQQSTLSDESLSAALDTAHWMLNGLLDWLAENPPGLAYTVGRQIWGGFGDVPEEFEDQADAAIDGLVAVLVGDSE